MRDAGITVGATRSFPDHHRYTPAEARALCDEADRNGLALVTTEKDLARLTGDDQAAQLAARAHALAVTLVFENEQEFKSLVLERIAAARAKNDEKARGSATEKNERLRLSCSGIREMSLQDGFRIGIGFLQIHAPILQLFERDRYAGHRAAHECAGPHDTEVAVEIFDLGLTCHWGSAIGSVQHSHVSTQRSARTASMA